MTITGASRVRTAELSMRPDRGMWVVGRVDTGDFVEVPPVAVDALRLLNLDLPVDSVRERLAEQTGEDFDIADFLAALSELGFLASVDGRALTDPDVPRSTFSWVRPRHVAWLLHPAVVVLWAGLVMTALVVVAREPSLLPTYRDLVWSDRGSLVLAGNALVGWTMILLHELGHLLAARAAGVPGRIGFGTRLQFLVAQTDVSGVWSQPRRVRLTVYIAGIAVDLALIAVAVLGLASASHGPAVLEALAAVVEALAVSAIASQFLLFMRTDLYFVLQDLTGCRNLYRDASAYLGWLVVGTRRRERDRDPTADFGSRERRAVRVYAVGMCVGTAVCLAVFVTVTFPATFALVGGALGDLLHGESIGDPVVVVVVIGCVQVLWARAWWRRHGGRIRRFFSSRKEVNA